VTYTNGSGLAVLLPYPLRQKPNTATGEQVSAQVRDKRLDHIGLQLRTVDDGRILPRPDKSQYVPKEEVWVEVLATNSDSKVFLIPYLMSFVHFLPGLTRAGEVVPYSQKMQKRIDNWAPREKDSYTGAKLLPNQLSLAATIKLSDWYDALQSGVYELKVKYRLYQNGPEVESDTVLFEIIRE